MLVKQLKSRQINKKGGFYDIFLATLAASLLGNILAWKCSIQAREGANRAVSTF